MSTKSSKRVIIIKNYINYVILVIKSIKEIVEISLVFHS